MTRGRAVLPGFFFMLDLEVNLKKMESGGEGMNPVYEKLCACYESIRARIPFTPEIALVLGSGLGNYASKMEVVERSLMGILRDFRYRQHRDMSDSLSLAMLRGCRSLPCRDVCIITRAMI